MHLVDPVFVNQRVEGGIYPVEGEDAVSRVRVPREVGKVDDLGPEDADVGELLHKQPVATLEAREHVGGEHL